MSNSLDAADFESQLIKAGPNFLAIFTQYGPEEFDALLSELETSRLSLTVEGETYQVFMNRVAAGMGSQTIAQPALQFFGVVRPLREYARDKDTYRPSIELGSGGDRLFEIFPYDDVERISKQLRTHQTPFNGLQGLLHAMGSKITLGSSDQAQLDIRAVLPFDTTIEEQQVKVQCQEPLVSKLSVLFFFSPKGSARKTYLEHVPVAGRSDWCTVPFVIPWSPDASYADAHVYYGEEEVEKFTVRHWGAAANWRLAIDNDFDPGSKLLRDALATDKKSELFEQAVVRLLNLGGIPATWYGASRESGKPDLAAYYEDPTRRIVVLGECTLEKPQVKFSSLKSRANKLRESLAGAADVLPIVFTSCDPVEADYGHAANDGIALLGRNELARILQLVQDNARSAEIIKDIEESISGEQLQYPAIARWAPRY